MGWWKERGEVEVLIWIRASKILAQGLFSAECLPLCRRLGCGGGSLSGAEAHQSSAALLQRVHVCFSFDKVHFIFLPKYKVKMAGFYCHGQRLLPPRCLPKLNGDISRHLEPFFHFFNQAFEFDWFSWLASDTDLWRRRSVFGVKRWWCCSPSEEVWLLCCCWAPFKLWAATDFFYWWNSHWNRIV